MLDYQRVTPISWAVLRVSECLVCLYALNLFKQNPAWVSTLEVAQNILPKVNAEGLWAPLLDTLSLRSPHLHCLLRSAIAIWGGISVHTVTKASRGTVSNLKHQDLKRRFRWRLSLATWGFRVDWYYPARCLFKRLFLSKKSNAKIFQTWSGGRPFWSQRMKVHEPKRYSWEMIVSLWDHL